MKKIRSLGNGLGFALLMMFLLTQNAFGIVPPIQNIPTANTGGSALDADDILEFILGFANYLFTAAGIILGVGFVWSGIVYMSAGSNSARVGTAKSIFKNSIIAALIILGLGTILATIQAIIKTPNTFFG